MNGIEIRRLMQNEEVPYDLLLLADPSIDIINDYVNRGEIFVANYMGEIVGVYVLIKTRPLTMELVNIAVHEKYQGKGIGKKLIFDAIKRAKDENIKVLQVGTGNSSVSQLALYQKCGFSVYGVDKDFFIKHYKEEIMENGIRCKDMIRLEMDL
ncbi:GNAT family N-acetyltransferase [Clostridium sp. 'White wine YQ']|uniref:GNAT family N-acetyltransferase n=1 Tax=Clostridium sp. 'White wine YQ' TaxID=3027474 RepID=UPI0023663D68|nr:GNAT family N-acetyltransferase [Clostridium sp. 'White wine YQ']MDD7793096.1 GNAT family N-acetyltransferase [Clostridium sp. 'White wine YQ']